MNVRLDSKSGRVIESKVNFVKYHNVASSFIIPRVLCTCGIYFKDGGVIPRKFERLNNIKI